jgi:Protein of unknown function (DUF3102)
MSAEHMPAKSGAQELSAHDHAVAIRNLGKRTIEHIIEIGRHLTEAKKIVGHGNWRSWLDCEFGWKEDTARRFMRLFDLSESRKLLDLSLPVSALYLLTAPSTEEDVRDEVFARAEAGVRILVADVKQAIATYASRASGAVKDGPEIIIQAEPAAPGMAQVTTNDVDPEDSAAALKARFAEEDGDADDAVVAGIGDREPEIVVEPAKSESDVLFELWATTTDEGRRTFLWRVGEQDLRKALPDTIRAAWEAHFRNHAGLHEAKKVGRAKKSNLTPKQLEAKRRDEKARQIDKLARTEPPSNARN